MKPDRQLVYGVALAVALLLAVVQWIVLPVAGYRASLAQNIVQAEQSLARVAALAEEHAVLSAKARKAGPQGKAGQAGQTLFALLENLAAKGQLRQNIEFIRPSVRQGSGGARQDVVEMRLNGVGLDQLVAYLEAVRASGRGVFVERMNLRSHEKRPLDVDLVFTAQRRAP